MASGATGDHRDDQSARNAFFPPYHVSRTIQKAARAGGSSKVRTRSSSLDGSRAGLSPASSPPSWRSARLPLFLELRRPRGDFSAATAAALQGCSGVSEAATRGARERTTSMKVRGELSSPPAFPGGGESSPHLCTLERPAVAWIGADEAELAGERSAWGERSAGGVGGVRRVRVELRRGASGGSGRPERGGGEGGGAGAGAIIPCLYCICHVKLK